MVSVALSGFFLVCFGCFKLKIHGVVLQHRMLLNFSSLSMHVEFQRVKSGPLREITDLWTILLTMKPQLFSAMALRVWHIQQANVSSALVPVIALWVCVSFHHSSSGINVEEWSYPSVGAVLLQRVRATHSCPHQPLCHCSPCVSWRQHSAQFPFASLKICLHSEGICLGINIFQC